jgi:low affinity Fe/Cu permease
MGIDRAFLPLQRYVAAGNTGTTIVTFLMVFLIQHTQNRDSVAMQVNSTKSSAAS